ncbi:hypothetical protein BH10ACT3_BH10ACT3_16960 [soil metagenome]
MTTAMHRDAEQDDRTTMTPPLPAPDVVDEYWGPEQVIDLTAEPADDDDVDDLWAPSLYGPPHTGVAEESAPVVTTAQPTVSTPIDVEELARTAAEVSVMVTRHREELAAAMAELTALQRVLRSEVRAVISELDRIAAGLGPEHAAKGDGSAARSASTVDAAEPAGRRSVTSRLRRRS